MNHLAYIASAVVGAVLALTLVALTSPQEPPCYEDSVWVWDGETDSHSLCVPIDVLLAE